MAARAPSARSGCGRRHRRCARACALRARRSRRHGNRDRGPRRRGLDDPVERRRRSPRRGLPREGDAAEHAAVLDASRRYRGTAPRRERQVDREQRRRPAGRCGRARPRGSRRRRGQEIAVCGPIESRWVRMAPVPCAKAQRSAKSMRARTSSATSSPRGRPSRCRAPMKVPSGFWRRGQMWPLSRWVCMSTKRGSTMPPSRSRLGRSLSRLAVPAGTTEAMRPSSMLISTSAKSLRVAGEPRTRHERERRARRREAIGGFLRDRGAGDRALHHRSRAERALVPVAEEKVGQGGHREEDDDARRREQARAPRRGAGC